VVEVGIDLLRSSSPVPVDFILSRILNLEQVTQHYVQSGLECRHRWRGCILYGKK